MKKKIIIILSIILVVVIGLAIWIFTKEDEDTTLTLMEKKWIESNKNQVIDFGIINNVPIFSVDGEGVIFDFLDDLEETTGLEFNRVSGDENTEYSFTIKAQRENNDILIDQDNYVLVMKEKQKINNVTDIKDLTIGMLTNDLTNVSKYLTGADNLTFKTYDSNTELIKDLETGTLQAIVLKKISNLETIIKNENLNIVYNITEYTNDLVIKLGSEEKLNDIITKYYQKWFDEKYQESFNKNLNETYFNYAEVTEKEINNFKSKQYKYGFIENGMYDSTVNNVLVGLNNTFIENFADMAGIEIDYKKFKSNETLNEELNSNNLDFIFNDNSSDSYRMDVYNTTSIYDEKLVIASPISKNIVLNSVKSLENEVVLTVKGSEISNYLIQNNVKVKQYDNLDNLIKDLNDNIIAIDYESYNYYLDKELKNYKIDLEVELPSEYTFTIRKISDNEVFSEFLDFYLSYISEKQVINDGYKTTLVAKNNTVALVKIIIYTVTGLLIIFIAVTSYKIIFRKDKKLPNISKDSKIKYIDLLTSLKNRNYLNDHIEAWDNSEIYPQTIIIVDLNNIAYINDNYGHNEGDEVIREAANILIRNQINNSEIIRTNGNEFLIYLVDYNEKDVVTYIRKLNKEFKDLAHGFGAAIGYSVINDGIKTIDDAINEATLDMRNNKEELNN